MKSMSEICVDIHHKKCVYSRFIVALGLGNPNNPVQNDSFQMQRALSVTPKSAQSRL